MAYFRCIGQGSADKYTIEQGSTISTNTSTATLTNGKYYLFTTVYGGEIFTNADVIVGDTNPIYSASGIGKTGCIIKSTENIVTYNRTGEVSANEYTELNTTNNSDIISISSSWNSGTSINTTNGKKFLLALGDGELGDIIGAEILIEHKLVDTISNGTRFLIVKAISNIISLDSGNSFYYRKIGLVV